MINLFSDQTQKTLLKIMNRELKDIHAARMLFRVNAAIKTYSGEVAAVVNAVESMEEIKEIKTQLETDISDQEKADISVLLTTERQRRLVEELNSIEIELDIEKISAEPLIELGIPIIELLHLDWLVKTDDQPKEIFPNNGEKNHE